MQKSKRGKNKRQAAYVLHHIISNLNKLAIYHPWVITYKSFMTVMQKVPYSVLTLIIAYF